MLTGDKTLNETIHRATGITIEEVEKIKKEWAKMIGQNMKQTVELAEKIISEKE